MTDHQEGERERPSNQAMWRRALRPATPIQSMLYIQGRSRLKAQPWVRQLGRGLALSPQGLRAHKAVEVKHLFARKHVVHGATQLMGEHGQRFGFAMFVFEC